MKIVLISTSDASAGRSEALDRLLASVARTQRPDISIVLLLLVQKCQAGLAFSQGFPAFVDVSSIPHQTSLSTARNVLLSRALSRGLIASTTVVGFPDDDCWFPQGTLEYIADQFSRDPGLDVWFCRYSSNPVSPAEVGVGSKPARVRDVVRHLSSTTIFVRGRVIQAGALFDESLGLGTPLGGGEDTEFGLHAYTLAKRTIHFDAAAVGHRDRNPQRRAKYYRGGLVAIAKHARRAGVVIELIRKIAVGGWLMLRRDLSLAEFLGALGTAFMAWRRAN
jgi:hypothetical protein